MLLIELMACKTIRKLACILSGIIASIWPLNKLNGLMHEKTWYIPNTKLSVLSI